MADYLANSGCCTQYVRLSAFSALSSAVETASAAAARALDKPDVPLVISSAKFAVNIVLDLLLISRVRVTTGAISVNTQAAVQLVCNLTSAVCGLAYFLWWSRRCSRRSIVRHNYGGGYDGINNDENDVAGGGGGGSESSTAPSFRALGPLIQPGALTFVESLVRNTLYLWLITTIVALGATYATAWGIFTTIRWGIVMVPVQALEVTALAFIGHGWGQWGRDVKDGVVPRAAASYEMIFRLVKPAAKSMVLALVVEVPLCVFLSLFGARPFAHYLSGSDAVADVTAYMWRTIDWCYVFYAMSTQLAAVLLATRPKWYLLQSLISNLLYVLPWAIVCQVVELDASHAWTYHSFVFGGSLVFSFVGVLLVDAVWVWRLRTGKGCPSG